MSWIWLAKFGREITIIVLLTVVWYGGKYHSWKVAEVRDDYVAKLEAEKVNRAKADLLVDRQNDQIQQLLGESRRLEIALEKALGEIVKVEREWSTRTNEIEEAAIPIECADAVEWAADVFSGIAGDWRDQ